MSVDVSTAPWLNTSLCFISVTCFPLCCVMDQNLVWSECSINVIHCHYFWRARVLGAINKSLLSPCDFFGERNNYRSITFLKVSFSCYVLTVTYVLITEILNGNRALKFVKKDWNFFLLSLYELCTSGLKSSYWHVQLSVEVSDHNVLLSWVDWSRAF